MPEDKKRRLVAIMFADVVGYTAMMQRNEQEGLEKVHRFSEVMEAGAQANNGEVLEFRGDGCLVVFDSAVEAVRAAKMIQEQLKEAPIVPLRIGIHIGDIVFTKGNIYGDGVNLASRVESMGIPGSILVTERVIHDVKSHPEFEMTSLGKFHFKNVEKPLEVFALANEGLSVPRPTEMKGKGQLIEPFSARSIISNKPILLSIFALFLLLASTWMWMNHNLKQADNKESQSTLKKLLRFFLFGFKSFG